MPGKSLIHPRSLVPLLLLAGAVTVAAAALAAPARDVAEPARAGAAAGPAPAGQAPAARHDGVPRFTAARLPQGFEPTYAQELRPARLGGNGEAASPQGYEQQFKRGDPKRGGAVLYVISTRGGASPSPAQLAAGQPGTRPVTVRGREGVLLARGGPRGLLAVQWVEGDGTLVQVIGRGAVTEAEVLAVAEGLVRR